MQITQLRMEALANDLAITDDYRTDQWIWAYFSAPSLRQLKRPPEVLTIRSFKRSIHID
jgi:hypothetical protein